jgi:GrpB-like predicted nucleotidyltransferase (UPF0157 family)
LLQNTYRWPVPFSDEDVPVVLEESRSRWHEEFDGLAGAIQGLKLAPSGAIDHIGSTAVPGLVSKDVIDVQVRVPSLERRWVIEQFTNAGFRHRPEEWNNVEVTREGPAEKLVFSPRAGARRSNVNVRVEGSKGARDALLFRDFLRGNDDARDLWGAFKQSILDRTPKIDLATYGQAKQPAWQRLMVSADVWASERGWMPTTLVLWDELDFAPL